MTTALSRILSFSRAPAVFTFVLSLIMAAGANAETTPVCGDPTSSTLPASNLKLSVTVDPTTVWQPRGGEVKFTIKGTGFSPDKMAIIACFRTETEWVPSPALRLLENGTAAGTATFSATVPPKLSGTHWDWPFFGQADSRVFYIVPLADFRVKATSMASPAAEWSPLDVTIPVGITSQLVAVAVAIVLLVIAGYVLYRFGRNRGVPGGSDPILTIISTKRGYASLSQLQILLWSFVIGASVVYVMTLSGNLIDISTGTLVLLGISGVTTVGSHLQSYNETLSAPPAAAPGPVVGLGVVCGQEGDREVPLSWAAPIGSGRPASYTVQYRATVEPPGPQGTWCTATSTLTRTGFRVVGLDPETRYDFQVNAAGSDVWVSTTGKTKAAPVAELGTVTKFRSPDVTNAKIELTWDKVPDAASYTVQYRVHDSDDGWSDAKSKIDGVAIAGLRANTLYDLRVAAAAPPAVAGAVQRFGPWTKIPATTGPTGPRIPLWSDLIVASDGQTEIDVTRVQMLFFTVIVALFVALRVVASSEIPAIPDNYLLLMGISNGVYLTNKFIPS